MRTMLDIPDNLYEQAQIEARLRGVELCELVEEGLREVLGKSLEGNDYKQHPFPLIQSSNPTIITDKDVKAALESQALEEDMRCARFIR